MPKSLYGRWRAERLVLIPDVNILVYAHNSRAREHAQAREWWEKTLAGRRPVGIPWVTILGFIRIMTNRKIVENPMHVKFAILRVRAWLNQPHVQVLTPGDQHAEILFDLLMHLRTAGDLTADAHLANFTCMGFSTILRFVMMRMKPRIVTQGMPTGRRPASVFSHPSRAWACSRARELCA